MQGQIIQIRGNMVRGAEINKTKNIVVMSVM